MRLPISHCKQRRYLVTHVNVCKSMCKFPVALDGGVTPKQVRPDTRPCVTCYEFGTCSLIITKIERQVHNYASPWLRFPHEALEGESQHESCCRKVCFNSCAHFRNHRVAAGFCSWDSAGRQADNASTTSRYDTAATSKSRSRVQPIQQRRGLRCGFVTEQPGHGDGAIHNKRGTHRRPSLMRSLTFNPPKDKPVASSGSDQWRPRAPLVLLPFSRARAWPQVPHVSLS